jgi:DnaK suppressor protein
MSARNFKLLIEEKIKALHALQNEAEAGCDTVTLDQSCVGRLSRMDAMQSQAMNQEAQRRRGVEIKRLEAALQSLAEDDYGYCEDCGEDISEGRLMIDPAAQYCIGCAAKRESR